MKVEQLNAEDALGLGERSIGFPGDIHLVEAPLDLPPASLCTLSVPLSEDEWRRAARLLSRREWRRWVAARGWMRRLLSAYLGCNAARIEFTYGCNGKPSLAGPQKADAIAFNMSHSGGLALFAFGRQVSLGVDVESVSRTLPWPGLAARFYSGPEAQHVLGLDEEHGRGVSPPSGP